jgi:hypothetical protein
MKRMLENGFANMLEVCIIKIFIQNLLFCLINNHVSFSNKMIMMMIIQVVLKNN